MDVIVMEKWENFNVEIEKCPDCGNNTFQIGNRSRPDDYAQYAKCTKCGCIWGPLGYI